MIDNASSDGLADEIVQLAQDARILVLGQNVGRAGAVNAAEGRGDLMVLLNPNAVVEADGAEAIRRR